MAMLHIAEHTLDPLLASRFTVLRRTDVVGTNGRTVPVVTPFPNVIGVVTAIGPNNLDRHDGYQTTQRAISIVTKFHIQGEVTGKQPDIIVWKGDQYVVKAIDYYHQFGDGFVQVECVSMDKTDAELVNPAPGAFAFNTAVNSMIIPLR